jgi:hypothetical protein
VSIKTVDELVGLVEITGHGVVAEPVRRYDELQSDTAYHEYDLASTQAKSALGKTRTVRTYGGAEVTGEVVVVAAELWSYKTNGEGWTSDRKIVGSDGNRKLEGSRTVVTTNG